MLAVVVAVRSAQLLANAISASGVLGLLHQALGQGRLWSLSRAPAEKQKCLNYVGRPFQ